jgi:hypothetical protein
MFMSRGRDGAPVAVIWLKFSFAAVAAACAIIGLVWLIWFCPNFKISSSSVEIAVEAASGTSTEPEIAAPIRGIIDEQVAARRFGIFPQSNIFFFDSSRAKDKISAAFYLQELVVDRRLPNIVRIAVKERAVRAATISDGQFWAMDDSGFAVRALYAREARDMTDLPYSFRSLLVPDSAAVEVLLPDGDSPAEKNNIYPLLINSDAPTGRRPVKPGEQTFPASVMSLALAADSRLTDICQDRVRWFDVRDSFETVEADMGDGWRVIMSSSLPFDAQAERLSRLLKGQVSGDRADLDYIDLRWGERIFIKDKEQTTPADETSQ